MIGVTNENLGTSGFEQTVGGTSGVRSMDGIEEGKRALFMHWNDKFVGLKEVFGDFSFFFPIPITKVIFDLNSLGEECRELVQWVDSLKSSKITIAGANCDFTNCMWVLENVKSIDEVSLLAEPREYLEAEPYTIEAKSLNVSYGQWIKPAHIRQMNAEEIWINRMDLTDAQVIEILDNLKNGSNSTLKTTGLSLNRQMGVLLEVFRQLDGIEDHEDSFDLKLNDERMCTINIGDFGQGAEQSLGIMIDIKRVERRENN